MKGSEDIPTPTDAPATASAAAPAAAETVVSEKTIETKSEEESAPPTPPVTELAPSDFSAPTNSPVARPLRYRPPPHDTTTEATLPFLVHKRTITKFIYRSKKDESIFHNSKGWPWTP
jgi:hypothetical protein